MSNTPPSLPTIRLERSDLIAFEQPLRFQLARFFSHAAYSLHFPGDNKAKQVEYIAAERKLMLPLYEPQPVSDDSSIASALDKPEINEAASADDSSRLPLRLLGVFVARGVRATQVKPLLPHLPALASLVMENLLLHKAGLCDAVSGLYTRQSFLGSVASEVHGIRREFTLGAEILAADALSAESGVSSDLRSIAHDTAFTRPCFGVLAVRVHSLRDVVREHGYLFADRVVAALGESLRELCPQQGMAARVGDFEFAVLLPASGARQCSRLAADIASAFAATTVPHSLTRRKVGVHASIGYALFPQDMEGNQFLKTAQEQARILLRKARLAAALAEETRMPDSVEAVMGFGRIVAEGGRVLDSLPLSRVLVSLGSGVNAREGQRFSVWSRRELADVSAAGVESLYKGEIVLMDVRANSSVAEIIHLGDPAWNIEAGDRLSLLPEETGFAGREADGSPKRDALTGLLRHGDFLARWSAAREECDSFSLGLLRLAPPVYSDMDGTETAALPRRPEELLGEAVRLCREFFGNDVIGGRYGLTSLIFFHPDSSPEKTGVLYTELSALLASRLFPQDSGICVAAGIAGYPYLNFRKADALENCQKALEYGLLLPIPHVGVFDSLALTISADKRFSAGDSFGALEEYKLALLADDGNMLAWNSLGVCLASLGRHAEARRYFTEALAREEGGQSSPLYTGQYEAGMALYNLGYSCQCLGEAADATLFYRRCLEQDPKHMFAMLRLGQLAERGGADTKALRLYRKAAELPGGESIARRHLAGLCLRQGKTQDAREYLHEALSLDPRNAGAMQMLARIYLNSGEDAEVAESLARQSVALRPDRKAGWLELARALEARGRRNEAREAMLRAGEL